MKYYKDANGTVFAYEEDGSQDDLIGDKIPLADDEVETAQNESYQKLIDALPYSEARQRYYPPIGDQLDALWHAMDAGLLPKIDAFYSPIASVKETFPK